ncbi:hypothetical protein BGW80DRAFT_1340226 [Lactifluus volemus]|nr:hypothetical protein BGW80DRAFT_1340226 [Lactifluus volemus]
MLGSSGCDAPNGLGIQLSGHDRIRLVAPPPPPDLFKLNMLISPDTPPSCLICAKGYPSISGCACPCQWLRGHFQPGVPIALRR